MQFRFSKTQPVFTFLALAISSAASAQDLLWDYLKNYKVGIENSYTADVATVSYDVDPGLYSDKKYCKTGTKRPDKMSCQSSIAADSQSGLGLFLQQGFKRKGFWHLDYDLGLSFRSMHEGMLKPAPDSPLRVVKFNLYGLFLKPHITFGITPKSIFPDILISLGPSAQVYWGSTTINHTTHNSGLRGVWHRSNVANVISYLELELVIWRFAKYGALSLFTSNERDTAQVNDGYIADAAVDQMTNIDVTFDRASSGIKLLLSWP